MHRGQRPNEHTKIKSVNNKKDDVPKFPLRLLKWFCKPEYHADIEGDLLELYERHFEGSGRKNAAWLLFKEVVKLFRPGIIRPIIIGQHLNTNGMYKSYFKIGWRNLWKNKGYSIINIGGLAAGMAVTMLIGLWIREELSYNKNFGNYDRVAQVWQFVTFDVEKSSYNSLPIPLAEELRSKYPDFESVTLSSYPREVILATDNKKLLKTGYYVEPHFNEIMSVKMISGSRSDLKDVNAIMLSRSLAKDIFGGEDPLNQTILFNEKVNVKITGVYEDFPFNSSFNDASYLASWGLYASLDNWVKNATNVWDENSWQIFAQLKEGADFEEASAKIKDIRMKKDNPPGYRPEFFLHPMSKWHLYSDFKNGVNTGGMITFVWLFGMIGVFVLVLACINFMNLATARSEKRAKEVGLRKSIGSVRGQLVFQFFCESVLTVVFSFGLALILIQLMLPFFNEVAGKQISILWTNPWFWALGFGISLITGLLAGSYPALYLSSFEPVKVLKGTFRPGRLAALPRKVLVVLQFTVSVTLMIGIVVVFRQIDFAQSRPSGYDRSGLIDVRMSTTQLYNNYETLRNDLLNTGVVYEMAESLGSTTDDYGGTVAVSWKGKVHQTNPLFMRNSITHEFGKTIGWKITDGRDFSRELADENSMIMNRSAATLMGFDDPTGETVKLGQLEYKVIGVVEDFIKDSPFKPVKPTLFTLDYKIVNMIIIKLNPSATVREAMIKIEEVFKKHNPGAPFEFTFVDDRYTRKFSDEQRIGKLSGFFAVLAVFISCLGIFGLASFVAEQRTKEIGIRKVMGASVFALWKMLSKEFVLLVIISIGISIPIAYYFLNNWLQNYEYRITISWWMFAATGLGALAITLLTVSYQSIRSASANPVKSLRSE
jgi:putative ABC transport system permease protein